MMELRRSFTARHTFFLIALVISAASFADALRAQQQTPVTVKVAEAVAIRRPSAPAPVIFTTEEDRRDMMEQLGITKLRPGRSSNADSPNVANYDEAKANPVPQSAGDS